jgi:hypothetical protein
MNVSIPQPDMDGRQRSPRSSPRGASLLYAAAIFASSGFVALAAAFYQDTRKASPTEAAAIAERCVRALMVECAVYRWTGRAVSAPAGASWIDRNDAEAGQ